MGKQIAFRTALALGLLHPVLLWGNTVIPDGYRQIASEYGIPDQLFYAIALAESGLRNQGRTRPWPWTLNIAGRGYRYPTRAAAWRALKDRLARGERAIDIGPMQVSWRYHRDKLIDPWRALDPYHNLRVAAGILKDCYQRRRGWWAGVGCYHAPGNPNRARRYRARVLQHWQRLSIEE